MKTAKQEAIDLLERLPDDVSMDTVIAELHFRSTLLRGLDEVRRGDGMSHEEVKIRLRAWRESFAPPADA